jgi:hypothetical protein
MTARQLISHAIASEIQLKVNRFGHVEKLADYPKVFERIV